MRILISFQEKHYHGRNIALPSLRTTCSASTNDANCATVMDGNLSNRWYSSVIDSSQWIQLTLNDSYVVQRIDVYHTCRNRTQCSEIDMTFSDGTTIKVNYYQNVNKTMKIKINFYYIWRISSMLAQNILHLSVLSYTPSTLLSFKQRNTQHCLGWNNLIVTYPPIALHCQHRLT